MVRQRGASPGRIEGYFPGCPGIASGPAGPHHRGVPVVTVFAPAKINLFLAVTGRRGDGFHDLVSVVAPLDLGDTLEAEPAAATSLTCSDPSLAVDGSNLVCRAAEAFARAAGRRGVHVAAAFRLEKRLPVGAGLGGGSSDAVAALRALQQLSGGLLPAEELAALAAELGSDCPLFLADGPVVMRGRGERLETWPAAERARLTGRRVLVFKPGFGVATPWAYGRLAAMAPASYLPAPEAERRLAAWRADPSAPLEDLLFNSFEVPVFAKHLALPALLGPLRERFGLRPLLSGSGSACFALLRGSDPVEEITAVIREAWGPSAFVQEARLG